MNRCCLDRVVDFFFLQTGYGLQTAPLIWFRSLIGSCLVTVTHVESNLEPERIVLCFVFFLLFSVVYSWFPERKKKKRKTVKAIKIFVVLSENLTRLHFLLGFWRESSKAVKDDGISFPHDCMYMAIGWQ